MGRLEGYCYGVKDDNHRVASWPSPQAKDLSAKEIDFYGA